MPDIHSPLAAIRQSGIFGAQFEAGPGVSVSETPVIGLVQIAGWGNFDATVLPRLNDLGFSDAGDFRQCRRANDVHLYRISPDRVLIAAPSPITLPASLQSNTSLAVLDLSHARVRIAIEGPAAEEVIARLASIDFREAAMPVGNFVQTGIHHVGVLIHRTSADRFEILVPFTWARSIWEIICLNAAPFGYDVKVAA